MFLINFRLLISTLLVYVILHTATTKATLTQNRDAHRLACTLKEILYDAKCLHGGLCAAVHIGFRRTVYCVCSGKFYGTRCEKFDPRNSGSPGSPGFTHPHTKRLCFPLQYYHDFPCNYLPGDEFKDIREAGKCLKFVEEPETWATALFKCNGRLLTLDHPKEKLSAHRLGGDYWIGLNDLKVKGQYWWNFEHKAELRSAYPDAKAHVPWDVGQPEKSSLKRCVVINERAMLKTENCHKKHKYICEETSGRKPIPPKIKTWTAYDYLEPGSYVQASCSGYIGWGGTIRWNTLKSNVRVSTGLSAPSSSQFQGRFKWDGNRCAYWGIAELDAKADPKLSGAQLECCTSYPDRLGARYNQSCRLGPIYRVNVRPGIPELSITYHEDTSGYINRPIQGTCQAAVGSQDALFIELRHNGVKGKWLLRTKGVRMVVLRSPYMRVKVRKGFYDPIKGPVVKGIFRLCVKAHLEKAQIFCYGIGLDNKPVHEVGTPPLKVLFPPQKPILKLHFHKAPNIVQANKVLHCDCFAFVGDGGTMTWVVNTPKGTGFILVFSNGTAHRRLGRKFSYHVRNLFKHGDPTFDVDDGPKMFQRLTLYYVTKTMYQGARISCYPYDILSYPMSSLFGPQNIYQRSEPLVVAFLPSKPKLAPITSFGDYVKLSCKAHIGDNGSLSWALITKDWVYASTIKPAGYFTSRLTKRDGAQGVDVNMRMPYRLTHKNVDDPRNGPTLASEFKARKSKIKGAKVACFARDIINCASLKKPLIEDLTQSKSLVMAKLLSITVSAVLFGLLVASLLQTMKAEEKLQTDSDGKESADDICAVEPPDPLLQTMKAEEEHQTDSGGEESVDDNCTVESPDPLLQNHGLEDAS